MSDLTDGAETRTIAWLTGQATTAPTMPYVGRLMTANGSDSAAGTEVVGGTYTRQNIALGAPSGSNPTVVSNTGIVRFEGLPATTVVGVEVWDSNGTPFRWWWKALPGAGRAVLAGDAIEFAVGELDFEMA
jgi:hypothetical protein